MKKLQQGFTLIELMIVVAIIGILAAIAVPAYQDYTIRSRVSEGASLAGAARTAVDVRHAEGVPLASFTAGNASYGLTAGISYNAKYVSYVSVLANGWVEVGLRTTPSLGLGTAVGKMFQYVPSDHGGNLQWSISTGSTVPTKYRPRT
ncbi:prepilin-type N-terminal cleavage/methylation domain-containing protein [Sulfuricaulis sp.]|jgi:type IV pilus assembly protein PilA|uniref:pilin n=1 Tax=Sulfuricaulis sp. TaxID=2003553 RepID=UPI00355ACBFF